MDSQRREETASRSSPGDRCPRRWIPNQGVLNTNPRACVLLPCREVSHRRPNPPGVCSSLLDSSTVHKSYTVKTGEKGGPHPYGHINRRTNGRKTQSSCSHHSSRCLLSPPSTQTPLKCNATCDTNMSQVTSTTQEIRDPCARLPRIT